MNLVGVLINRRRKLGLSQRQVSKLMGTSTSSLCQWEQRKYIPRADHLERWAAALGMEIIIIEKKEK